VTSAVKAAGVDTWSVCWYLQVDSPAARAMERLATVPAARSKMVDQSIEGHRIGWFPGPRLLFAEGHPGGDGELCPGDQLPKALERVSEGLKDYGILPPAFPLQPRYDAHNRSCTLGGVGFGGVRRLDSTVDLRFSKGAEGLAALAGVAALPVPRVKTQVMREVGGHRIETVYLRGTSGKRVLGRWYDKGIETKSAKRGEWVRPEDQRRYDSAGRLDVELIASGSFVRDQFVRRFEPLWRASKGVKVAGAVELAERISELVDEGVLTPRQAKSVAGWLLLEQAGANRQSRATYYRDRRRCADLGLVVADGTVDPVEVDLEGMIEDALDSGCWGQG
jgi:hypothetical protein